MAYDQHILEDLKSRVDIVDVIGSYIELRRAGSNYKCKCPFHDDRNPSMIVSPHKQIFKCFVCGAGGNAFTFVRDYTNVNFTEAVQIVADRVGYNLPKFKPSKQESEKISLRDSVLKALDYTANFYHHSLYQSQGKHALDYLHRRGLTDETIKKFNLGYAPNNWEATKNELLRVNFDENTLFEAKIILKKEGGRNSFDMFRNRLMFPIRDNMGRTIAFGGRKLDDDPNSPKYINSPESIVYSKSNILYGLFENKRDIMSKNEVLLVEGYMDLIALSQFGFQNAAAPCGTAFTQGQATVLKRFSKAITIMNDSDEPGLKASEKALEITLQSGLTTKIVTLPEGEDPDDILKTRGEKTMRSYIKKASNFVDFLLFRNQDIINTPEGKAVTARTITKIIATIPDKFVHDDYMQQTAGKLHLSVEQLKQLYREKKQTPERPEQRTHFYERQIHMSTNLENVEKVKVTICDAVHLLPKEVANKISLAELNLLKIIINSESPLDMIENKFDIRASYFRKTLGKNIFSIIYEHAYETDSVVESIAGALEIEDYFKHIIASIAIPAEELNASWDKYGGMIDEVDNIKVAEAAINEIIRQHLRSKRRKIEADIESCSDSETQRQLMSEMIHLDKMLREKDLLSYAEELLVDDTSD